MPTSYSRKLTPRRKEVLAKLLEGKPTKIVAYELGLGEATIKVHTRTLLRIYGCTSTPAMISKVYQQRLGIAVKALTAISLEDTGTIIEHASYIAKHALEQLNGL